MNARKNHEVVAKITRRGLVLAALLAMALSAANTARAQSVASIAAVPAAAPPVAAASVNAVPLPVAKPSSQGAHEGIKVHGHWTIEVRNPDGSVASHQEFDNALDPQGGQTLTGLLGGTFVPGGFLVLLDSSAAGGAGPCSGTGSLGIGIPVATTKCSIIDSRATANNVNCLDGLNACAKTLTFTPSLSAAGSVNGFSLAGSITANLTGTVGYVSTAITYCGVLPSASGGNSLIGMTNPTPPYACANTFEPTGSTNLTSTTLTSPVPVASGQSVGVTVAITFSSGS
jgi:hypothetical protein